MHIACAHCGTTNRVPDERLAQDPVCGRCGQPLLAGEPVELTDANFEAVTSRTELPVVVDFWASWCGPCRKEMPLLDQLYQQYKPLGFTVLGVNVEEDPAQARTLLGKVPVSFPVLFDGTNAVSKQYDVVAMPTTVMVDRNGKMRYLHKGYMPGYEDAYQQQVRALLTERM